jgi:DMSO reductase anchor subunit
MLYTSGLVITALVSLLHLGRKLRFFRAVSNIRSSPLSREILAFIVFSSASFLALFTHLPGMLITSIVAGFVLLITIDGVYFHIDKRLQSGQTFLSALLITSFFSGAVLPFLFISVVKIILTISKMKNETILKLVRIAILIITGILLFKKDSGTVLLIIFLAGELLDRILFYIDFDTGGMPLLNKVRH